MTAVERAQIQDWFSPRVANAQQKERMELVNFAAATFVEEITRNLQSCADRSAAIRKVREAAFTAIYAISHEEPPAQD